MFRFRSDSVMESELRAVARLQKKEEDCSVRLPVRLLKVTSGL